MDCQITKAKYITYTHTPMKIYFTDIRVTITKRQDTDGAEWESRENNTALPCWEECRPDQSLCKIKLNKHMKTESIYAM